jgi:hypothetical protein
VLLVQLAQAQELAQPPYGFDAWSAQARSPPERLLCRVLRVPLARARQPARQP